MKRKQVLGIALIISLIGLLLLILIANFYEIKQVNISELENKIEQRVCVSGKL